MSIICQAPDLNAIGDGWCDPSPCNNYACNYDGGDCCSQTCVDADYPCGINGYNCKNPDFVQGGCNMLFSFDDTYGSYQTWSTSFVKYDGLFQLNDDDNYHVGYIYVEELFQFFLGGADTPGMMVYLHAGDSATFTVVPGKFDSNGDLMPCEIESEGSGPCLNSRSWETSISAKSFLNSVYSTEGASWIAPMGSSMTVQCTVSVSQFESILRPTGFTGEGRMNNNVPPPSFHASPPLPHESTEFTLTLKDGSGNGWWNTIKYHSNQYVLDDGENIVHRGTLVDKAETTEKFRLKDGTYTLRMLGAHDSDAYDDTWSFMSKDIVIGSGGKFDSITFTLANGEITSTLMETPHHAHETIKVANFPGLTSKEDFNKLTHNAHVNYAQSISFSEPLTQTEKRAYAAELQHESFTFSLRTHPIETASILLVSTLFGMVTMYGISRFFIPSKNSNPSSISSYSPVMDISQNSPSVVVEMEKKGKSTSLECKL